jgi:outer membrane protein assembly factor BamB
VLGAGIAGPAYGAGLVFVMTADRSVMAIDPANGDVVWSHPIVVRERDLVAKTTATVDFAKGLVIASGPDIPLQALDAKTGNARWTTAGTSPTPAFRGVAVLDDVVAAANTTGVAAFDLLTGEPLWAARTPPVQGATARGSVVVALADKAVVAVERSTGKVRWTAPLPTTASARPSFESDTIIVVVDDDGGVHRLALDDGRIVATVKAATCRPCTVPGQESASQPTMVAGFVVVGTDAGVVGIDTRTSTVAWTYPTRTPVTSSPVPAGRTSIVVATASPAALVEIDVTSGRQLSSVPLPAPPSDRAVVLKSRVVVSTLDGRVRAVGR